MKQVTPLDRTLLSPALALVLLVVAAPPARAEIELGGFAQVNYAARVTSPDCSLGTACELPLGEERLQLKVEGYSEDGLAGFSAKVDLFHDAVDNEAGIDVREVYADLTTRFVTVRAGRQIITWGVGDLLFVNDLFPKDWVAFFTGRPLQYLKMGSDAIKVGLHLKAVDVEVVAVPFFAPDNYPTGERLILYDPFPPALPREVESRDLSLENIQVHVKISRYFADWEVALYGSRTFFGTPAMTLDDPKAPTKVRLFFPRLNALGASVSGGLLGGVLSLEGAYYDSEDDRDGADPAMENSQVRGLLGYSHALWEDATLGLQGYVEWMQDHDTYLASMPAGFPARDEVRVMATARFTQLLLHQTLTINLFAFWGITEQDAYLIPSIRYAITDALWAELGLNIFLRKDKHTMFGMVDNNDNIYITARYGF